MRRNSLATTAIYAIGLVVLFAFSFVPEASAFKEPDVLIRQIKTTAIKDECIAQILDRLATDYEIPLGIVLGDEKLIPRREIDLNVPETTLKDFLDSVIGKDPRYTWKLEGGVIHVQPVTERDALLTTLLDTKISHFAFTESATRYAIFNDILKVPEIQSQLIVADVAPLVFRMGLMQRNGEGISFQESNLTLRDLLDRIVLRTHIRRWVLLRWGKNSEYISLKGG